LPITVAVAITITTTITMSKPEYPIFNTQTPELRKHITTVINTLSSNHLVRLKARELFIDPEDAFIRIRN
jgi:hypothetical protein